MANLNSTDSATSAEADYSAKGLQETVREAIVSTREVRVIRRNVSETQRITRSSSSSVTLPPPNNGGGGGRNEPPNPPDPIAQSFMIDQADGCYITSVDTFFATKSTTIPVRAEIRRMNNGMKGFLKHVKNRQMKIIMKDINVKMNYWINFKLLYSI